MWRCGSPECNCEGNRRRYLDKDQAGATGLVRTLTPMVEGILARMLRYSREEREDVQQVIFLKMFHKLGTWKGECPLCLWVKKIAVREAFNQFRIEKSRKRPTPLPPDLVDPKTPSLSPEVWKRVERVCSQLPVEKQRVYDLHVRQGMTIEETAKTVGQSVRTVYGWMAEIRERFKSCLD